MPRHNAYPPEVKAIALAALATGATIYQAAETAGVTPTTIIRWRREVDVLTGVTAPKKRTELDLGGLVAKYLREAINTLAVQARQFRDPAWLARQNAADAAILHGVMADKILRVVSSLRPVDHSTITADVGLLTRGVDQGREADDPASD